MVHQTSFVEYWGNFLRSMSRALQAVVQAGVDLRAGIG